MRGSGIWLKHLNSSGWNTNGTERFYFRPKHERSPFPKEWRMPAEPPHHPAFLSAYAKAWDLWVAMRDGEVVQDPVYAGSLAEAAVGYKASHAFSLYAVRTRNQRQAKLEGMIDLYGKAPVAQLEEKHVQKDLSRFTGHAQIGHLKMWRGFAKYLKTEYGIADPTRDIDKAVVAQSDGHEPWSMDDVAHFRKLYQIDQPVRLALELLYWTGARCGDAVRLGRGHVTRDGWLSFKQNKTGGQVDIPFNRALPDFAKVDAGDLSMLHDTINAQAVKHITFLCTKKGASRSGHSFSKWFSEKSREIGLDNRTAHGLRKSRAIRWAESNATTLQIGAWTGHTSLSEIERYIRKYSRRQALSGGAKSIQM